MDPLALTGAIPALIAMWVFDHMDRHRPEPRWTLRKVALAGALSVIPIALLQLVIKSPIDGSYEAAAYNGFVVAAMTEEAGKMLCVYWFVWHKPEFDERLDGIVYAARAGLGFALVENVLYLMNAAGTGEFWFLWGARALLAVPGHAIWAGLMGYYVAIRRFDGVGWGFLGGYAVAVLLHGLYDAALFSAPSLVADFGEAAQVAVLGIPIAIILFGGLALRKRALLAFQADSTRPIHGPRTIQAPPG